MESPTLQKAKELECKIQNCVVLIEKYETVLEKYDDGTINIKYESRRHEFIMRIDQSIIKHHVHQKIYYAKAKLRRLKTELSVL